MPFQIYNPCRFVNWDAFLEGNDQVGFFHTSTWANVLTKAYHYRPVYFANIEKQQFNALLPVMEIDSILTGKRGVALPFTDSCPPIATSEKQLQALITTTIEYAGKQKWQWVEFRTEKRLPLPVEPTRLFRHHTLHLEGTQSELEQKIRKSTLRNTRNAERSGARIKKMCSLSSMRDFYRLNCLTRKRHGLPPQPWYFFETIFKKVLQSRKGELFLAIYGNKVIAGAIFLHFKNRAIYKFGASDERLHHLRANNLIMWSAIQHYFKTGYKTIDFGRTDVGHSGLLQYKRGWGTREDSLYYYRFDVRQQVFTKESDTSAPGYRLLKILPISILRLIGHFLYPHVG